MQIRRLPFDARRALVKQEPLGCNFFREAKKEHPKVQRRDSPENKEGKLSIYKLPISLFREGRCRFAGLLKMPDSTGF
jgi:hypothetical protein